MSGKVYIGQLASKALAALRPHLPQSAGHDRTTRYAVHAILEKTGTTGANWQWRDEFAGR
ncbi:MAG TPA: hypothetical protein VHV08_02655 [Pirellulales bacterium]|jgi:hypothetical protein|nr:hypothetical protein [Pirellulales bacterium]